MSQTHTGNIQPGIDLEEHDGLLNAKRVAMASTATIYAVVNTSASGQASVVLDTGLANIGFATVSVSNPTLYAVVNTGAAGVQNSMVTLNAGPNYIGLASIQGNIDLNTGARWIGLATTTPASAWPDPKTFIGLATVTIGAGGAGDGAIQDGGDSTIEASVYSTASGGTLATQLKSVTGVTANLDATGDFQTDVKSIAAGTNYIGLASIRGDVDLNTGARWIGLATITPTSAWPNPNTYIGLVTVGHNINLNSNITLNSSINNIGFATVYNAAGAAYIGLASVNIGGIAAGVNYIGLMSINGSVVNLAGAAFIGLATVVVGNTPNANVSLSNSISNIGFATVTQAFPGSSTVFSQVISTTGNTTIFVAPASNRFFIKNLHVSSLGRAEFEFRSGATTLIPFTSLSTTSGWGGNYGEEGWPSRAQADSFVANLNGAATIAIGVNVRFAP